jgi:Reverse transcriptase (RNA-dependent DNA polymerase)
MDFSHSTSEMNTRSRVSVLDSLNSPTTTIGGFEFTESLKPETSKGSSLEGPRGKRDIKSLYDETFPIELEYLGLCLLGEEEPSNYEEAIADLAWRKAKEEEISIIQKNGI